VFLNLFNNNKNQRTRRLIPNRREKTWRPKTHSLAERQVTVLGRHGHMTVYRRRSPWGRVNSRNGSLTQVGEVHSSSSPLRWKRWASSAPQPANSSAVWITEFPAAQARLERHVFSFRESRCCYSASTLSYSTTVCRR